MGSVVVTVRGGCLCVGYKQRGTEENIITASVVISHLIYHVIFHLIIIIFMIIPVINQL